MKRAIGILVAFFVIAIAIPAACAQSLGELAKKEEERRAKVKADAKVITNTNIAKYRNGPVTTSSIPLAQQKTESEKAATESEDQGKVPKPSSDEPTDLQGRPESFWRQTLDDARKRTKDLENEANALTLKLADLQMQFFRESSGFRQQDIQREIQKTFYEQDLNKQNLAKAKDLLQELEKEARKSGALPGWLTPKNP